MVLYLYKETMYGLLVHRSAFSKTISFSADAGKRNGPWTPKKKRLAWWQTVWEGRIIGRRLSRSEGLADSGLRATGPCLSAPMSCGSLPHGGSAGQEGKLCYAVPSRRGVIATDLPPQPGRARDSVARKPKRVRPRVLRTAATYVAPLSSRFASGGAGDLPGCRFFFCPLSLWTRKEKMDIALLKMKKPPAVFLTIYIYIYI